MGSASRSKPEHLAVKLSAIRNKLDLSQTEIANNLSDDQISIRRSDVSRYETGIREPSLIVLLRYAKLAGMTMEMLVDDEIKLKF
jgi:transcriptional regulator with XRE-family HTH domain